MTEEVHLYDNASEHPHISEYWRGMDYYTVPHWEVPADVGLIPKFMSVSQKYPGKGILQTRNFQGKQATIKVW